MAYQRQSSYRGGTQCGTYRRNTLLRVSQLVAFFGTVGVLFGSAESIAQSTVSNNLRITNAVIPSNICSDTSASVSFKVEGNGTITPVNEQPAAAVYLLSVASGSTSCPSAVDQGKLVANVTLNWTSGAQQFSPNNPDQPYTATVASLGFCDQISSKPNWVLCVYAWNDNNKSGTIKAGATPVVIAGSIGGGGGSTTATAPVVKDITVGDGQISFNVTTNKGDSSFEICYVEVTDSTKLAAAKNELDAATKCEGGTLKSRNANSTNVVLDNLTNDTSTYYFKVGATNGTLWSATKGPFTPTKSSSTLELYDGEAGGASWKCDQGQGHLSSSSVLFLFGFLGMTWMLSRSRRQRVLGVLGPLTLGSLFVLAAVPAQADFGQLNLGIFGGPYKPNIDANTTFKTYKCLYNDAVLPMLGAELDLHLGDPFGSIQLGTAIGYSWATGKAIKTYNATDPSCDAQVFSDNRVALHMLQIRPRLSYVFDPYVEDFPLVPFVRAGIIGAGYYFTYQGSADTRGQDRNVNPVGIRFGWEASFGLMFLLDAIEPSIADKARGSGTYDHSYLKAEIAYQSIDDFGTPGLNFSPASTVGEPANFLGTLALVFQFQ